MPYYLHASDYAPEYGTPFEDRQQALLWRLKHQTVTFVASRDQRNDWQDREYNRFESGQYLSVPWNGVSWAVREHYAHLSVSHPGMIAYTPDDEYGVQDRQMRIKPGKYLKQIHPEISQADIDYWLGQIKARGADLQLATSARDIEAVYVNGPRSCMSHHTGDYRTRGVHPTAVYADSDLAIAYVGDLESYPPEISARCVVWPEKKIYGRRYGDGETLERILRAHGYEAGSMEGAKVRAISVRGDCYAMPYIDGVEYADLDGKYFVLGDGDYSTTGTDGVAGQEERYSCEHCGASHDNEDSNYCESCESDRQYCEGCDEDHFDGSFTEIGGTYYCESCTRERTHECEACGESWEEDTDSPDPLCSDCAATHARCDDCEEWTATDDLDSDGHCADCHVEDEAADSGESESPAESSAYVLSYSETPPNQENR